MSKWDIRWFHCRVNFGTSLNRPLIMLLEVNRIKPNLFPANFGTGSGCSV